MKQRLLLLVFIYFCISSTTVNATQIDSQEFSDLWIEEMDVLDKDYTILNMNIVKYTDLRCTMQKIPINGFTFHNHITIGKTHKSFTQNQFYAYFKTAKALFKPVKSSLSTDGSIFWMLYEYPKTGMMREFFGKDLKPFIFDYFKRDSGGIDNLFCVALPANKVRKDTSPIQ